MMTEQEFYICKHCGNVAVKTVDNGPKLSCCGDEMGKLEAHAEYNEKHTPVVSVDGNKVHVVLGDVQHPMMEKHFIEFIFLQTEKGGQRVKLTAADKPEADFALVDGDKALVVYAYCNVHGLWKKEL
jgi:superoxide reductase